jgi:LSD1 subclass zinc finger protein
MLQITCPSCNRPLSLPESMQGKQVRCPLCSKEFQAGGNGSPPAPAPAAAPYDRDDPGDRPYPPPRRRDYDDRRPGDYDRHPGGYDDREAEPDEAAGPAARARASASVWFLISGILDALLLLAFYLFVFTVDRNINRRGPPFEAVVVITILVLLFYVAPLIFVFIAAGMSRNPRASGMVITGSVMSFILAMEQLILGGIFAIVCVAMLSPPSARRDFVPAMPIVAVLSLAGLVLSILAGVKGLIAVSQVPQRRRPRYYD